jgi:hypothetical protein
VNYGVAELNTDSLFDLRTLKISANTRDGKALPIIVKQGSIEVYIPIAATTSHIRLCVQIANAEDKPLTATDPCQDISLAISDDHEFGEQVTHVGKGRLPFVQPQAFQ